jgi:hypothetical protein
MKMKSLAYWDGVLIKDIVNNAFEITLHVMKKKNGEIKRCLKNDFSMKKIFFFKSLLYCNLFPAKYRNKRKS